MIGNELFAGEMLVLFKSRDMGGYQIRTQAAVLNFLVEFYDQRLLFYKKYGLLDLVFI